MWHVWREVRSKGEVVIGVVVSSRIVDCDWVVFENAASYVIFEKLS